MKNKLKKVILLKKALKYIEILNKRTFILKYTIIRLNILNLI